MKTFDPAEKPAIDPVIYENARSLGLGMMNVICNEPDAKVGEISGVSFIAFGRFVPRKGERISLDGGVTCEVQNVLYGLARPLNNKLVELIPNVWVVRVSPPRPD